MFSAKNLFFSRKNNNNPSRPPCPGGFDYLDSTATNQCAIYYASSDFRQNLFPREHLRPPYGWISQQGPNLGDPTYFYTVFRTDNMSAEIPNWIPIYYGSANQNVIANVYKMNSPVYCGENEYGPYYMGQYGCLNFPIYCCGFRNYEGIVTHTGCVMQGPPGTGGYCQEDDFAYTQNGTLT